MQKSYKGDCQLTLRKQQSLNAMSSHMDVLTQGAEATTELVIEARKRTITDLKPYYGKQLIQIDTYEIARNMGFPEAGLRNKSNGKDNAVAHVGHISKKLDAIIARQDSLASRLTIIEGMVIKHLGGNKL